MPEPPHTSGAQSPSPNAEALRILTELAALDAVLIVHAEDARILAEAPQDITDRYATFLASRPRAAENTAIERVLDAARDTGARTHILHLSSSEALPAIRAAKREGVRVTVETCPHYLTFASELIPDGATEYKCCPPLREDDNRRALWEGLKDGTIDHIASDHSPCTIDLKRKDTGDFGTAWGGIASVQLGLPAVWATSPDGSPRTPARASASPARGPSPSAMTPTSPSSPPRRPSSSMSRPWSTRTRSRRTRGAPCAASSSGPCCGAGPSIATPRPAA